MAMQEWQEQHQQQQTQQLQQMQQLAIDEGEGNHPGDEHDDEPPEPREEEGPSPRGGPPPSIRALKRKAAMVFGKSLKSCANLIKHGSRCDSLRVSSDYQAGLRSGLRIAASCFLFNLICYKHGIHFHSLQFLASEPGFTKPGCEADCG